MSLDLDKKTDRGKLIVFAAPSGGGKSTIISSIMENISELKFSVSATTRPRREGEIEGVHYHYLSDEEFRRRVDQGHFIEYEEVHGKLYGTLKTDVEKALEDGKSLVFDLDVLGALSIKKYFPEALLIYIDVPSVEVLRERLLERNSENKDEIEFRLTRYEFEHNKAKHFNHIVMNDNLERACLEAAEIVKKHIEPELPVEK